MKYILFIVLFFSVLELQAQVSDSGDSSVVLTGQDAADLFKELGLAEQFQNKKHIYSEDACLCIDSINGRMKSDEGVAKEIGACIEKQIDGYLMTEALSKSLFDTARIINVSTGSELERKRAYFEIERYLMDTCQAIKDLVKSDDQQSLNSMSADEDALAYYYEGIDAYKEKDFRLAAKLNKKALAIDENFAFAWDNLGLCYRNLKEYDKAIAAYKKSLVVSPSGQLPLQNIPIVYEYMNEPEKALKAYNQLLYKQPDNPEGYFGKGRMLMFSMNKPKPALHSMCQAYNIYKKTKNPYRADAEKVMGYIHQEMSKTSGGKKEFNKILEQYDILIRFAD